MALFGFGRASEGVREDAIREALKTVQEPELHRDIVSLDMVRGIRIRDGTVGVTVELTTPACPLKKRIEDEVRAAVLKVPGVRDVGVEFGSRVSAAPRAAGPAQDLIPGVKNAIAIASGKGGVGKSTVAVNVAVALSRAGAAVGILDADLYGPSVPRMLALKGKPPMTEDGRLSPHEAYGVKVMSMGFLVEEDQPVIWRGPMVHKGLQFCLGQVDWGELDYLIIDLPPGTGDVQLTLVQSIPLSGSVIVCTPQDVAFLVAMKGLKMFQQVNVHILGVVENMSYYVCPGCGRRDEIFSHGGAKASAERHGVPFLGAIPIDTAIRASGDAGKPIVLGPASPVTAAYQGVIESLAAQVSMHNLLGAGAGAPEIRL